MEPAKDEVPKRYENLNTDEMRAAAEQLLPTQIPTDNIQTKRASLSENHLPRQYNYAPPMPEEEVPPPIQHKEPLPSPITSSKSVPSEIVSPKRDLTVVNNTTTIAPITVVIPGMHNPGMGHFQATFNYGGGPNMNGTYTPLLPSNQSPGGLVHSNMTFVQLPYASGSSMVKAGVAARVRSNPISRYNFFVDQYNHDCNRVNNIYMKRVPIYGCVEWMYDATTAISDFIWRFPLKYIFCCCEGCGCVGHLFAWALHLVLLYFAYPLAVFFFVTTLVMWLHMTYAGIISCENDWKVKDPFARMYNNPRLLHGCSNNYFEVTQFNLSTFYDIDVKLGNHLSSQINVTSGKVQQNTTFHFMAYNQFFIDRNKKAIINSWFCIFLKVVALSLCVIFTFRAYLTFLPSWFSNFDFSDHFNQMNRHQNLNAPART